MFFTPEALQANSRLRGHWNDLWANRNVFNSHQQALVANHRSAMSAQMLAANNFGGFGTEFWQEIDRQIIESRNLETGMEIVNDLMDVQTVLPVGKTVRLYNVVGDIADDVAVSIDGQAPYSFDHTEYGSDGDPIPVFTAGYGVNWRLAEGLSTVGIDLVLDSQRAKERKFYKALVNYMLDGSNRINVGGYNGQGLRNHRNTVRIDLGAGGANIDLTTASQVEISEFFTSGVFGGTARSNFVDAYDVMWVSPEVWANLNRPATVSIGGDRLLSGGSVLEVVRPYIPVRDVRQTFALSGNEFIAYQRRRDVVTPLVGMATGVVPLPRQMPQSNYNFQIMAAIGLQIARDAEGRSGVVYGADLT